MSQILSTIGQPFTLPNMGPSPSLDGSAVATAATVTSLSASLTTTKTNDIIIACVFVNGSPSTVSISDGYTLSWNTKINGVNGIWEFWAYSASALSSDSITVSFGSSVTAGIIVFGVNGANTSLPFDPALMPSETGQSKSATTFSLYFNTDIPNTFVFQFWGTATTGETFTVQSGWTTIQTANTNVSIGAFYQTYTSTQTQVPATATISTAAVLSGLIDALHSAPSYIIQPPATVEWIIHNIFYRAPCVVVYTNGTNTIMTFNPTTGGQTLGLIYHVSNALYFVLYCTNANASTNQFGFNGVRSL